jgi:hypothetical protein
MRASAVGNGHDVLGARCQEFRDTLPTASGLWLSLASLPLPSSGIVPNHMTHVYTRAARAGELKAVSQIVSDEIDPIWWKRRKT